MKGRITRSILGTVAVLGLLALGGAAGAAETAGGTAATATGASYRVTLITGDVVQVNVSPQGFEAGTVKAAPRGAGRAHAPRRCSSIVTGR